MAKVEVKVIEVESTKLDPNAKYIILLDPAEYNLVKYIEEGLIELIGPNFLILPLQASQLKVLEVMPEPKPQTATEIAMQIWKEQNAEKAAMQTQQESSDHYLNQARQHEQR